MTRSAIRTTSPRQREGPVLGKALLRAADRLGISARALGGVIGVSEPTVSRLKKGEFVLERGTKPFELAVLLVRFYRSLDAILGGDEAAARAWMRNENTALGGKPVEKVQTVSGLVDAIAYLDARRAQI
jgi:transcriptional regulator with XRE-family HTH domain